MDQSPANEPRLHELAKAIARELLREFSPFPALDVLSEAAPHDVAVSVGPLVVDFLRHEATLNDASLDLKPREFALLAFMARNAGRAFTRAQLLDVVWPEDIICKVDNDRTVDVHVCRIRRKLGAAAQLIRTITGVGYKLETAKAPP